MRRVLIGKLGNEWVLRVSAPGYDVLSAPHYRLIFDSIRAGLQLHATGVANVPTITWSSQCSPYPADAEGTTTVYFPSVGYVPLVLAQQTNGVSIWQGYWRLTFCPSNFWFWMWLVVKGYDGYAILRNRTEYAATMRWAVFTWQGV